MAAQIPTPPIDGRDRLNQIGLGQGSTARPPVSQSPIPVTPGNVLSTSNLSNFLRSIPANISSLDSRFNLSLRTFEQLRALTSEFSANNLSVKTLTALRDASERLKDSATEFKNSIIFSNNRQPNFLRFFNHYNYIITLGILSVEEFNNPISYRERGFSRIILQSGGGSLKKRQQVPAEKGDHAEYFIENLNIEAVVSPNSNTGITLGTTVEFDVTEPYSMGKFTEALVRSAAELGFSNFTTAPFCLRIDFRGWDDAGRDLNLNLVPYYIPINIINAEFSVNNSGSTYHVRAVAPNDLATSNTIDDLKTEIQIAGTTVFDLLEEGTNSLANRLNDRSDQIENPNGKQTPYIPGYDRFLFVFPSSETGLIDAIEQSVASVRQNSASEDLDSRIGGSDEQEQPLGNPSGSEAARQGISIDPKQGLFEVIKTYAQTDINEIGRSLVNTDSDEGSNQSMIQAAEAMGIAGIFLRNIPETDVADKAREFNFQQNDKITDIIQSVVLNSEYIKESLTESGENNELGKRKWFRIDTSVFIEENKETEQKIGRKPKIFVYAIYTYEMDQSIHAISQARSESVENLKQIAPKEYNYIYTGLNEDVLNFDIDFNYSFLQAAYSDFGNYSGGPDQGTSRTSQVSKTDQTLSSQDTDEEETSDSTITNDQTGIKVSLPPGKTDTNPTQQKASLFHDRLVNSNVDMLIVEMTIWGDPYFLPTINGNFVPAPTQQRMINSEGRMQYLTNEIDIIVNFFTPLDYGYRDDEDRSLMNLIELQERFSGLYRVTSVKNIFNNGEFKQQLNMIRPRGQNDEGKTIPVTSESNESRYDPHSSESSNIFGTAARLVSGVPRVLPQFAAVPTTQVSQQLFNQFSRLAPPQVFDFQAQHGNIANQVSSIVQDINASARSTSAAIARAAGPFANQTPSALNPNSSTVTPQTPVNTQTATTRPPTR